MNQFVRFVTARWTELLIAGVYLQSLITALFTGNPTLIALVGLGGLALLLLLFSLVGVVQRRRLQPRHGLENLAYRVPRLGIIFTVGNQPFTLRLALRNQKPRFVGFICTSQSEEVADALTTELVGGLFPDLNLTEEQVRKTIVDPWSVRESQAETKRLLAWMLEQTRDGKSLSRSDLVVDVTGGTTPMSVAAFSIAEEWQVDSQYIRSRYVDNKLQSDTQDAILLRQYLT